MVAFGLAEQVRVGRLTDAHRRYLAWHRGMEFQK